VGKSEFAQGVGCPGFQFPESQSQDLPEKRLKGIYPRPNLPATSS
jgi:hypothetical protein